MRCCAGSLCSTDPTTQENVLDHASYTVPSRQRELDHTDQECICLPRIWKVIIIITVLSSQNVQRVSIAKNDEETENEKA